jgi:hypothetical protein
LRAAAGLAGFFLAAAAGALADDFLALLTTGLAAGALGASPSTDLTGQILNKGHFWHPTAMAIGQMVMTSSIQKTEDDSIVVI